MGAAVYQLQGEKRLLLIIRPGAAVYHWSCCLSFALVLLIIRLLLIIRPWSCCLSAAVYQLQGENGCYLSFALVLLIIGAAGAPLLTCAHGYVTDIQEGLDMLQVSPSILDRVSCLFVSSSSIDLGLGLGSLHTGYTYLHSWKRSWTGSWIPRTACIQSSSSIDLDRLSVYRSRRYPHGVT